MESLEEYPLKSAFLMLCASRLTRSRVLSCPSSSTSTTTSSKRPHLPASRTATVGVVRAAAMTSRRFPSVT